MDMLNGKYWGSYKKINEEIYDEDFFADFDDYIDHNKVQFEYFLSVTTVILYTLRENTTIDTTIMMTTDLMKGNLPVFSTKK